MGPLARSPGRRPPCPCPPDLVALPAPGPWALPVEKPVLFLIQIRISGLGSSPAGTGRAAPRPRPPTRCATPRAELSPPRGARPAPHLSQAAPPSPGPRPHVGPLLSTLGPSSLLQGELRGSYRREHLEVPPRLWLQPQEGASRLSPNDALQPPEHLAQPHCQWRRWSQESLGGAGSLPGLCPPCPRSRVPLLPSPLLSAIGPPGLNRLCTPPPP